MGPSGRLVIYQERYKLWPTATKDGVSVARQIKLPNGTITRLGADMVIQAANRQLRTTGDGTTLTCVLANSFAKYISEHGDISQETINRVLLQLKLYSEPVLNMAQLIKTATVSANNDSHLGMLVGESVWKTGKNGVVLASREFGGGTRVEYQKGYHFNSGINYAEFVDPKTGSFDFGHCYVVVCDGDLAWARQLLDGLKKINDNEEFIANPKPIIVFCPTIRDEALAIMVKSYQEKKMMVIPISPEGTPNGAESNTCLADIAAMSGATLISSTAGMRFQDLKFSYLGKIDKINSKFGSTVIFNENSNADERISELNKIIELRPDTVESEFAARSIARLTGAVATIHVGGDTDTEINERMDRVDDAIRATKCALVSGIVDGGGVALVKAIMNSNISDSKLLLPFFEPLKQIWKNAGKNPEKYIALAKKTHKQFKTFPGYDIETGQIINESMINKGISDPADVVINAIKNAISVARTITSCDVAITEEDNGNAD